MLLSDAVLFWQALRDDHPEAAAALRLDFEDALVTGLDIVFLRPEVRDAAIRYTRSQMVNMAQRLFEE